MNSLYQRWKTRFNIEMFHFLHFIIRVVGLHFDGYKEDFLNGISNNE